MQLASDIDEEGLADEEYVLGDTVGKILGMKLDNNARGTQLSAI